MIIMNSLLFNILFVVLYFFVFTKTRALLYIQILNNVTNYQHKNYDRYNQQ